MIASQDPPWAPAPAFEGLHLRGLHDAGRKPIGQDQFVTTLRPVAVGRSRNFVEAIVNFGPRRETDRSVAWDRPRRSSPNYDRCIRQFSCERFEFLRTLSLLRSGICVTNRKLHPNRIARVVVVLDLGFGERGLLHHAPHHRLGAAEQGAVERELHQLGGDGGLGPKIHGRVVVPPVALDAEALELVALHADPVLGELAALLAELVDGHFVLVLALGAVLLLDLPLDGQAVAVPARHVVGIEAQHLLGARHHVLQDLVERGAHVDVGVGVGGAVVQDELGPALGRRAQAVIEPELGPALEQLGLELGQPGPHGERGLGQEQGRAPVARGGFGVGHGGAVFVQLMRWFDECTGGPRTPSGDRAYNPCDDQLGRGSRHGAAQ